MRSRILATKLNDKRNKKRGQKIKNSLKLRKNFVQVINTVSSKLKSFNTFGYISD